MAADNPSYASHNGMLFDKELTSLLLVPEGMEGAAVLPNSLAAVPACFFSRCIKLSAIEVPTGSTANARFATENGILYTADKTELLAAPAGLGASATIAEECTTIAEGAFAGNTTLQTIISNGTVTEIAVGARSSEPANAANNNEGNNASIPAFTTETIENATVMTDNRTAWEAAGFTNFTTPVRPGDEFTEEGEGVGLAYTLLEDFTASVRWTGDEPAPDSVEIPSTIEIAGATYTVSTIAEAAFADQPNLHHVTIPNSVTVLGESAFAGSALATVDIPGSIRTISANAFAGCANLTDVTLYEGTAAIAESAFAGTAIESITLPETIATIADNAFAGCKNLNTILALGQLQEVSASALAETNGVDIYVPLQADEAYAFTPGAPAQGNHLMPYGIQASDEPIQLEVGDEVDLDENSTIAAPGDIEVTTSYKSNVSVTSDRTLVAKKIGTTPVETTLALGEEPLAANTQTVMVGASRTIANTRSGDYDLGDNSIEFYFFIPGVNSYAFSQEITNGVFGMADYDTASISWIGDNPLTSPDISIYAPFSLSSHPMGYYDGYGQNKSKLEAAGGNSKVKGWRTASGTYFDETCFSSNSFSVSGLPGSDIDWSGAGNNVDWVLSSLTGTGGSSFYVEVPALYPVYANGNTTYLLTLHDGNSESTSSYVSGVGSLPTPTKTGYEFMGWCNNAQLTGTPDKTLGTSVTGNKELWAKWEVRHSVIWDANGGKFWESSSSQPTTKTTTGIVPGSKPSAPSAPLRSGYGFAGWYKDQACTQPWTPNDTVSSSTTSPVTITLYAKWEKEYDIGSNNSIEFWFNIPGDTGENFSQEIIDNANGMAQGDPATIRWSGDNPVTSSNITIEAYFGLSSKPMGYYEGYSAYKAKLEAAGGNNKVKGWKTASGTYFPESCFTGSWFSVSGLPGSDVNWPYDADAVLSALTGGGSLYAEVNLYPVYENGNTTYTATLRDGDTEDQITYVSGVGATLPTRTKANYTFMGWCDNVQLAGTPIKSIPASASGDKEYWAKWEEITYTVTYKGDGIQYGDIEKHKVGETVTLKAKPSAEGYVYTDWSSSDVTITNGTFVMPAKDVVLVSTSSKATASYQIQHYQQNVTGTGYTLKDTDSKSDTVGDTVTATAKTYTGFNENTTHADRKASGAVAADGSLVLKLYYDRETYTVTFNSNGGTAVETKKLRYGDGASKPADPTRTGYTFGGWFTNSSLTSSYTFGTPITANVDLYAKWDPKTDTSYKIEHYQQGLDGTYAVVTSDIENKTGRTGATANAVAKSYTGFVENTGHPNRKASGEIAADGSLILRLYYDRKSYTITYDLNGGSIDADKLNGGKLDAGKVTFTVKYGATVPTLGGNPAKAETAQYAYAFKSWDKTPSGTVSDNATYVAQYTETAKKYTVTYNLDGGTISESNVPSAGSLQNGKVTFSNLTYGSAMPTLDATKVTKSVAPNDYVGKGWKPSPTSTVTGNAEYTIDWNTTQRTYSVAAQSGEGVASIAIKNASGTALSNPAQVAWGTATTRIEWTFKPGYELDEIEVTKGAATTTLSPSTNAYIISGIDGDYVVKVSAKKRTTWETKEYTDELNIEFNVNLPDGVTPGQGYYNNSYVELCSAAGGNVEKFTLSTIDEETFRVEIEYGSLRLGDDVDSSSLFSNSPSKEGYTFKAWTLPSGATVDVSTLSMQGGTVSFECLSEDNGGGPSLAWIWNHSAAQAGYVMFNLSPSFVEKHTITWDSGSQNGALYGPAGPSKADDSCDVGTVIDTAYPVYLDGFTFLGWWEKGGKQLTDADRNFLYTPDPLTKDVTYIAKWRKSDLPVGWESRDYSLSMPSIELDVLLDGGEAVDYARSYLDFRGDQYHDNNLESCVLSTDGQGNYRISFNYDYLGSGSNGFSSDSMFKTNPTKKGYRFAGWKLLSGSAEGLGSEVTSFVQNLSYQSGGGSFAFKAGEEYAGGGSAFLESAWNDFTVPMLYFQASPEWVKNPECTVTFQANGGTPAPSAATVQEGSTVSEPAAMTKAGYTFGGWFTDEACTQAWDFATPVTSSMTLYAKWTIATFTVTLNLNGGTLAEGKNVTSYTYGTGAQLPSLKADIWRDGFEFAGWFTDPDFAEETRVASITATDTGDKVLYAKWDADSISYVVHHHKQSLANPDEYDDEAEQLTTPKSSTTVKATVRYIPGFELFMHDDSKHEAAVTNGAVEDLHVYYNRQTLNVLFATDTAAGTTGITKLYGQTIAESEAPQNLQKAGYVFAGWFADAAFTQAWTFGDAGDAVEKSMTLYAKWEPVECTITWDANGGAPDSTSAVKHGESIAAMPAAPVREGYVFLGWGAAADATEVVQFPITNVTEDRTFYALWAADTPDAPAATWTVRAICGSTVHTYTYGALVGDTVVVKAPTIAGWQLAEGQADSVALTIAADETANVVEFRYDALTTKVVLNALGGSGLAYEPVEFTYGQVRPDLQVTKLVAPVGHKLVGWADAAEGGTLVYDADGKAASTAVWMGTAAQVELFAQYAPVRFTIEYLPGEGAAGTTDPQVVDYGQGALLKANPFTAPSGKAFGGWSDGATVYPAGAAADKLSTTDGATVQLTAVWVDRAGMMTITWKANGGTFGFAADGSPVYSITNRYAAGAAPVAPSAPTRLNYIFNTDAENTNGTGWLEVSRTADAVVYEAQWHQPWFKVTFAAELLDSASTVTTKVTNTDDPKQVNHPFVEGGQVKQWIHYGVAGQVLPKVNDVFGCAGASAAELWADATGSYWQPGAAIAGEPAGDEDFKALYNDGTGAVLTATFRPQIAVTVPSAVTLNVKVTGDTVQTTTGDVQGDLAFKSNSAADLVVQSVGEMNPDGYDSEGLIGNARTIFGTDAYKGVSITIDEQGGAGSYYFSLGSRAGIARPPIELAPGASKTVAFGLNGVQPGSVTESPTLKVANLTYTVALADRN